jgi:hypothetical protein
MECPRCGADLKGKDICSRCGRRVEPAPGIEVEYKDFKISEYLEIRQKEHRTSSETGSPAQDSERKGPRDSVPGVPNADEKTTADTGRTPGGRRSLAVAIILLLVAVAGAFYLWRFLMR